MFELLSCWLSLLACLARVCCRGNTSGSVLRARQEAAHIFFCHSTCVVICSVPLALQAHPVLVLIMFQCQLAASRMTAAAQCAAPQKVQRGTSPVDLADAGSWPHHWLFQCFLIPAAAQHTHCPHAAVL